MIDRVHWLPFGLPRMPVPAEAGRCCGAMRQALTRHHAIEDPFDCPESCLIYHAPFDEYGIPVRDGGETYILIGCCPWCGKKLPPSQRGKWLEEIEAAGLSDADAEALPQRYLTSEWRTA